MKGIIDMQRTTFLYGTGVVVLMLFSLVMSNVPALQLSTHIELAWHRQGAAVLAGLGGVLGTATVYRHLARVREPWRVPQSQVAALYLGFFLCTLVAALLAK